MNLPSPAPDAGWSVRRVLVTGADGFVGYWLVQALVARGAEVWALTRPGSVNAWKLSQLRQLSGVTIISKDISDLAGISASLRDGRIDTVYHLAANNTNTGGAISPYEIFETNIRGAYTVLEAARTLPKPAKVILASSKEVEDCFVAKPSRKFHPYMVSKASVELIGRAYYDSSGILTATMRSDNLYGGGDFNWSRLIPGTIRSVLHGETPVIRGNGLRERDYVYVEDAVAAYLAIGERLDDPAIRGQLFRVATGIGTSVLDMVKQIALACGRPDLQPRVLNEKSEERTDTFHPEGVGQTVPGWKCRYSLEEGLMRACQWYRDFFKEEKGPGKIT